jgi:hypothetical protein
VRFRVPTVPMAIFWDVTTCGFVDQPAATTWGGGAKSKPRGWRKRYWYRKREDGDKIRNKDNENSKDRFIGPIQGQLLRAEG